MSAGAGRLLPWCLLIYLLSWPLVGAAQPCQLFVSRGEARISGGGDVRLVKSSAGVRAGESVEAASATTIAFLRSHTRVDRLEGRAVLTCPASGSEPSAAALVGRLIDHLLTQATVPSTPAGYRGPVARADGTEALRVLYPAHDSRIIGSSVTFAWNLAGDAFAVSLSDSRDRVVWTRVVAGSNSLPYPADAAPLAPGETYVWSVGAAGNEQQRASATFATATAAQRQDIERRVEEARQACSDSGTRATECALAAAGLLAQAGYANDALAAMIVGLRDAPQDRTIALLLGQLLAASTAQNER